MYLCPRGGRRLADEGVLEANHREGSNPIYRPSSRDAASKILRRCRPAASQRQAHRQIGAPLVAGTAKDGHLSGGIHQGDSFCDERPNAKG